MSAARLLLRRLGLEDDGPRPGEEPAARMAASIRRLEVVLVWYLVATTAIVVVVGLVVAPAGTVILLSAGVALLCGYRQLRPGRRGRRHTLTISGRRLRARAAPLAGMALAVVIGGAVAFGGEIAGGPADPVDPTTTPTVAGRTPAWLPADPRSVNDDMLFGVSVDAPRDGAQVAGGCIRLRGRSALPVGRTVILAARRADVPDPNPFTYFLVDDWFDPDALPSWTGTVTLRASAGQKIDVAVLVGKVPAVQELAAGPTDQTASLRLVHYLTVLVSGNAGPC
ncbi:hypothetical protein AB0J80_35865 [Actinoplanes sp. NPDC049548]|uniref:hypothetical protein n=1 Tax=Actinoplanes sp. NPDC049548 TaxID=3155152 RepID=UPI003432D51F